jgi:hypothetical protein
VHAVRAQAGQLDRAVAELFASGRVVDLIIAFVVLEAILVVAFRRWTGRGPSVGGFLACILPGLMLMLALRAALVGADWPWIALCLSAALVGHLTDLYRRAS